MRIQHNIMAMNAYRNYNRNTSALSKNLERLSSGYKINRAGDDAAGLAISEKMRAQITGLEAAQKNVKDGTSLVNTAEGAMQEIQDMLNRMVYLATQSSNGTYDNEVDRKNLQDEVNQLRDEINRIADSANFNGIKLLDGSLDADVNEFRLGEQTDIPILPDVATDPTNEVGDKTVLKKPGTDAKKTSFEVYLHNTTVVGNDGDELEIAIGDDKITLTFGADGDLESGKEIKGEELAQAIADKIAAAEDDGGLGNKIGGQDFTITVAGDTIKFEQAAEPTQASEVVDADLKFDVTLKPAGGANPNPPAGTFTDGAVNNAAVVTVGGTAAAATNIDWTSTAAGSTSADTMTLSATVNGQTYTVTFSQGGTDDADTVVVDATKSLSDAFDEAVTKLNAKAAADNATGAAGTADYTEVTNIAFTKTNNAALADGTATTTEKVYQAPAGRAAADFDAGTATAGTAVTQTNAVDMSNATGTLAAGDVAKIATGTLTIGDLSVDLTNVTGLADNTSTMQDALNAIKTAIEAAAAAHKTAGEGGTADFNDYSNFVVTASGTDGFQVAYDVTPMTYKGGADPDADADELPSSQTGTINVATGKNVQGSVKSAGDLASTTFDITADMVKDGASVTIGKDTYVFKVGKDSETVASGAGQKVIDLSNFEEGDAALLNAAKEKLSQQDNSTFTIGYDKATGKMSIHEKEGQGDYTTELMSQKEFDKLVYANKAGSHIKGTAMTLQIGDTSDSYNQLSVSIKDMHCDSLGIDKIDISNPKGASDAINVIKDAINTVSSVRGNLGAISNRLDHTANNLSVMRENIQDAESAIRDTDIAEEMMSYTKNNILVQSAQAMLAQANQVPQGVLQLLQ